MSDFALGFDAPDDPANRAQQVRDADRQQAVNDLAAVMATKHGQRALRRILEDCGVFRTSFSGDPLHTAFKEGKRDIGLRLIDAAATADRVGLFAILAQGEL